MKILIADDMPFLASALAKALSEHRTTICFDGKQLLQAYYFSKPDAIITNIKMPVVSGEEAIREIRQRDKETLIICITGFEDKTMIKQLMRFGVQAVLLKGHERNVEVIEEILEKRETVIRKPVADILISDEPERQGLTNQEIKIKDLYNAGRGTKDIARILNLSPLTIKKHIANIFSKGYIKISQITRRAAC